MNLKNFSQMNRKRCEVGFGNELADWSPAEWTNAMCGESGEAANVAKKILRHTTGARGNAASEDMDTLRARLIDEIADVIIYADLCIQRMDGDTSAAVISKWNRTSEKIGYDVRIEGDAVEGPPPLPPAALGTDPF